MRAATTSVTSHSSFVGREPQLSQLDALLTHALDGAGRICFVGGEPGVGKTALLQEFARRAQQDHPELVVAVADCSATGATSDAYLPFREILGLLTGDTDAGVAEGIITAENASRLRTLVDRAGDIVAEYGIDLIDVFVPGAKLVTRVGGKLAQRLGVKAAQPAVSTSADDPARVLQQFTNVVRKLAEMRPLILIIDDVHWADRASLDLLFHLARRIEGSRILLLGTYRANEVTGVGADRHPLQPILNEVARYYGDTRIILETDDASAGRSFVDRLIDAEANQLSPAFRDELYRHTLGHPLFTIELLNALRERGTLVRDQRGEWQLARAPDWSVLPARTEGVIAERIGRVPQELRDLLAIAAVEGEQFSAPVVARVAASEAGVVVKQLTTAAEQHQLIRAIGVQKIGGQRIATYRFRHELFRAYLYGTLDEVQRSELHFAVGSALEQQHASELADAAPLLAHHFERAGESDACVRYLDLAAESAMRRHAPSQAAEFWGRALQLLDAIGSDRGERAQMVEKRGDALRLAGAFDHARAAYEDALLATGAALGRARLLRKQGAACADQHLLRDAIEKLEQAESELARSSDEGSALERVKLWLDRGWALYWLNEPRSMEELLERGAEHVERFGTPEDRARWLQMRVLAGLRSQRYRPTSELLELTRQLMAAVQAAGHGPTYAHCVFMHGFAHLWHGDLDTAHASLLEALRAAEQLAHGLVIVLAKTYLTVLARLRGDVDAAMSGANEAEAAARERGMITYMVAAQANRAWAHYRRNEPDQVEPLASEALAAWATTTATYPFKWLGAWPLAAVLLQRGERERAREVLDVALAPGQQIPPPRVAEAIAAGDLEYALEAARAAGEL